MAKTHENSGVVNLIGVGTTIVGEIKSSGDIRVDEHSQARYILKEKLLLAQQELLMEM